MTTIHLREYLDSPVALMDEDAIWLVDRLGDKISIRREFADSGFVLNPNQYVGVVSLPSGLRIECQPKVPIGNFFQMLAIAFDLEPEFRQEAALFLQIDEVFEFIIRHFAELVDHRIDHGLYRNYQEREDNLTTVRGRIATGEDMRLNHILRHRTYCRFSEFTWDIQENQVVRQVAHMVSHWVRTRSLRGQLVQIDRLLHEVTPTQHPARIIDRFTYHRLNDDYEPIHKLCRLFLEGSTLSEDEGVFEFRTFLFNMNDLFERFVTAVLRQRLPIGLQLVPQDVVHLDEMHGIRMRPDIVIRDHGTPLVVADCKYKRLGEEEFKHPDNYQMLAYCTALGLDRGVLIYPRDEVGIQTTTEVRNSPVRIEQVTVNLNVERGEFDEELDRLATRVYAQTQSKQSKKENQFSLGINYGPDQLLPSARNP